MNSTNALRKHVRDVLTARQAHATFEDAVSKLSPEARGTRPEQLPYSVWELVEHIRRAQYDILAYCRDPDYESPDWPDDYWPEAPSPPNDEAWDASVAQVRNDRNEMVELVMDENTALLDPVPASDEHTYLREALLIADHTAYHIGQIVAVRRCLQAWPPHGDV